jgi:hypothetical protein
VPAPTRTTASAHLLGTGSAPRPAATSVSDNAVIGDMRPATGLSRENGTPSQLSTPQRVSAAYSSSVATGKTAAVQAAAIGTRRWSAANAISPRPMNTKPNAVLGTITRQPGTTAAGAGVPHTQLPSTTAASAATRPPVARTGGTATRRRTASITLARPSPGDRKDLMCGDERATARGCVPESRESGSPRPPERAADG